MKTPLITSIPSPGIPTPRENNHYSCFLDTPIKTCHVRVPCGTDRCALSSISLYVGENNIHAGFSSSHPNATLREGEETYREYRLPTGCDIWEVAAKLIPQLGQLPETLDPKQLPLSTYLCSLYPHGFQPLVPSDLSLANAHKFARKEIKRIGVTIRDKNVKARMKELMCYLWQSLAMQTMQQHFANVLMLSSIPGEAHMALTYLPKPDDYE